jgi:hypothetical protein
MIRTTEFDHVDAFVDELRTRGTLTTYPVVDVAHEHWNLTAIERELDDSLELERLVGTLVEYRVLASAYTPTGPLILNQDCGQFRTSPDTPPCASAETLLVINRIKTACDEMKIEIRFGHYTGLPTPPNN